jgi:hypothetical protein
MTGRIAQPSLPFDRVIPRYERAVRDEYAPPRELPADQAQVLAAVRARRGRAAAIGVGDLAAQTGLDERRVQIVVKHLVEEHQAPIGTGTTQPWGYYWITSDEERREVRDSLVRRAVSTLRRARAYDRGGWVAGLIGQAELELGDVPEVSR